MYQTDPKQNETSLPLGADPAWGAIVGTFLLAMCLAGPVGLVLAIVAWVVIDAIRRSPRRGAGQSPVVEPRDDDFAARFHQLENDILRNDRPEGSA
jgi:hypothetical protein